MPGLRGNAPARKSGCRWWVLLLVPNGSRRVAAAASLRSTRAGCAAVLPLATAKPCGCSRDPPMLPGLFPTAFGPASAETSQAVAAAFQGYFDSLRKEDDKHAAAAAIEALGELLKGAGAGPCGPFIEEMSEHVDMLLRASRPFPPL